MSCECIRCLEIFTFSSQTCAKTLTLFHAFQNILGRNNTFISVSAYLCWKSSPALWTPCDMLNVINWQIQSCNCKLWKEKKGMFKLCLLLWTVVEVLGKKDYWRCLLQQQLSEMWKWWEQNNAMNLILCSRKFPSKFYNFYEPFRKQFDIIMRKLDSLY